jgi:hypothetical protein
MNSELVRTPLNTKPDPAVDAWVKTFQVEVRKNWQPPNLPFNKRVVVLMQIHSKTGQILKTKMTTTSCNPDFDQSTLNAIQAFHSPTPLPASLSDVTDFIEMLFTFDSSIPKDNSSLKK